MPRPTKEVKMMKTSISLTPEVKAYYSELAWQKKTSLSALVRDALVAVYGDVPEGYVVPTPDA